jgi:hypothetical protein
LIARLLLANLLEIVVGLGVTTVLGAPPGAAYLTGLALVGVVSAQLGLVHVSFGWIALAVAAAIAAIPIVHRRAWRVWRPGRGTPWTWAGVVGLAVLLVRSWPVFAAQPLNAYDGWAIWGMKAKALTDFGWVDPTLFAAKEAASAQLGYPLLVPSLEAVASRAMGGFEPTTIHLQFLLFAVAGFAAFHALLRDRVRPWLLWPWLLALAAAPAFLTQLLTAYADVPLALLVGGGLLAAARWLDDGRPASLALATLFLAAAGLTKSEGILFAAAAYLALLLARWRRWRPLLVSAVVFELLLLPWQIWVAVHHVSAGTTVNLTSPRLDHPGIGPLAFRALLDQSLSLHAWPLLLPLFVVAVLAAAGARVAVFAWAWALAAYLLLTGVYVTSTLEWSNYFAYSGDRVVDTALVGMAVLTPLLASQGLSRIGRP